MTNEKNIAINIEQLIEYAVKNLALSTHDTHYVRNALIDHFNITSVASEEIPAVDDIQTVIDTLVSYGIANGLSKTDDVILYETKLFGMITPPPSSIINHFNFINATDGIENATNWYFDLSKANNYVRMADVNKNIMWDHSGTRGNLVVTINLSKPEKDPAQIAAALKAKTGYPACMLCTSNVGFAGNAGHPARQTLRIIPTTINNEEWSIQYSPYQYYEKHLIALCNDHRPMKVDENCMKRLIDFVSQFPHFFLGSNAALPIVGGSILTHDHYQGGGKGLPMFTAGIKKTYKSPIKGTQISVVDWYNSVVRITSKCKEKAVAAASYVLDKWATYSDESVGIICKTDAQHNAITPIARYENGIFIMDMILRNNATDDVHPFGIYHPTEDLHNIKKEGIGIIEVMGTFILPGRLDKELAEISKFIDGTDVFNYDEISDSSHPLTNHKDMIRSIIATVGTANTNEQAVSAIRNYINTTCEQILECTAVFKNTDIGSQAFEKFIIEGLGCK